MLIAGPAAVAQAKRVETLGCQLDVAPTIMSLIGRPYDSVFYGRDLLSPASARFALLNHNRSIALYREPELVALSLGKVIERFTRTDRKNTHPPSARRRDRRSLPRRHGALPNSRRTLHAAALLRAATRKPSNNSQVRKSVPVALAFHASFTTVHS